METTQQKQSPDPTHCDSVTLYYRQGSSDKVYQAWVAPKGSDRYAVEFAYGRRGSTLKTGTKTREPVTHGKAHTMLWKLVRQKMDKGYTPGEDGTPYAGTDREGQATGIACQLLNPVDGNDLARRIADPRWCMQRKFDGRRLLVKRDGDQVTGINRRGLETGIPATTSILALNEAFRMTGVERFALVTPYIDEVQDAIVANYRHFIAKCCVGDAGKIDHCVFATDGKNRASLAPAKNLAGLARCRWHVTVVHAKQHNARCRVGIQAV